MKYCFRRAGALYGFLPKRSKKILPWGGLRGKMRREGDRMDKKSGRHILIVDDDEDLALIIALAFNLTAILCAWGSHKMTKGAVTK